MEGCARFLMDRQQLRKFNTLADGGSYKADSPVVCCPHCTYARISPHLAYL